MSVTKAQRRGHVVALVLGLLGGALDWAVAPSPMDRDDAVAQAQPFLDTKAEVASLSLDGTTWTITADGERAVLDSETGELLEVEF